MKPAFADIVIVGAGPVGLVFAQELAKTNSVILLDKNAIPSLHKSWASPIGWLQEAGLERFASAIVSKAAVYYGANGSSSIRDLPVSAHIAAVDETRLYKELLKMFAESGGVLKPLTTVNHYFLTASGIELITSTGTIKAKLLLDCTGVDSPFIKKGVNIKQRFYWNVYGYKYDGHTSDRDLSYLCAYVANYQGLKLYINDMPEGKSAYTPWMYIMSKRKLPLKTMRDAYTVALESKFLKPIVKNHHQQQEKYGWIPAAEVNSHASDRILSLGDASALSPWSTAATFSFMLHKLKPFCQKITEQVITEKLSQADLNQIVKLNDKEELMFDLSKLLFITLLNLKGNEFEKIAGFFADVPIALLGELFGAFEADMPTLLEIIKVLLRHFTIIDLLNIFGRDGFSDELRIGHELLTDVIRYYL